jgi:hypothetical protein
MFVLRSSAPKPGSAIGGGVARCTLRSCTHIHKPVQSVLLEFVDKELRVFRWSRIVVDQKCIQINRHQCVHWLLDIARHFKRHAWLGFGLFQCVQVSVCASGSVCSETVCEAYQHWRKLVAAHDENLVLKLYVDVVRRQELFDDMIGQ